MIALALILAAVAILLAGIAIGGCIRVGNPSTERPIRVVPVRGAFMDRWV